MDTLTIGRMMIGPPLAVAEPLGDPVGQLGGAAVPGVRTPPQYQLTIATFAANVAADTIAARFAIRRQLRSMFNNSSLKYQGFLYVVYSDDPENNGWYVPDQGSLSDWVAPVGVATGAWQLQSNWFLAGHMRTHREGRQVWMKSLTTGLYQRDTLGAIFSTDFQAYQSNWGSQFAPTLTVLPPGAASSFASVSGIVSSLTALPAGADGGVCYQASGLSDLVVVTYDRPEAYLNTGDVVVYDRRGVINGPFYRQTVLADNPSHYWRMDATSGTTETDIVGGDTATYQGGYTLNQTGALTGSGDTDPSVTFNGTTGRAQLANPLWPSASVANTGPFSLECWFKLTSNVGTAFISQYGAGHEISLIYYQPFQSVFLIVNNNAVNVGGAVPTATLTGFWHHLVGTYDGSNLRLYLDGGLLNTTPNVNVQTQSSNAEIGYSAVFGYFGQALDEVAVYNYALSAQQVAAHYDAGVAYGAGITPQNYEGWEEVYGPDYPWNWLNTGQPADCPVLQNGLCRVRYDGLTAKPGFRLDVWNGGAYVEQGKITFARQDGIGTWDDTWVSASLREWTPDRAVISVVLRQASDPSSREQIFVTLARGQIGATFEIYPAPLSSGSQADGFIGFSPALLAGGEYPSASALKSDSQSAPPAIGTGAFASAWSGATSWAYSPLGNASFATSENWMAALFGSPLSNTAVNPYQVNFVVLQQAIEALVGNESSSYGVTDWLLYITGQGLGAGYAFAELSFAPTASDQILEAESFRSTSSTASQIADGNASGGQAVQDTQTSFANPTLLKTSNLAQAKYRFIARVRLTAGGQGLFGVQLGATIGTDNYFTSSGTSYGWIDLGDVLSPSANPVYEVWCAGGSLATPTGVSGRATGGGNMAQNTTYYYEVTALNQNGETIGSTQAPVSLGPSQNAAQLNWTAVPGAVSYKVYRSTTTGVFNTPAYIANPTTNSYLDTAASPSAGAPPTSGTATFNAIIDRVEAFLVEDRVRSSAIYSGCRDAAQSALYDARTLGTLTARV